MNIVPDIVIAFDFEGRQRLDYRQVPLGAWRQVKQQAGYTPATLLDGLEEFDLDAIAALVFLHRSQTSRRATFGTTVQDLSKSESEFDLVDVIHDGESLLGDLDGDEEPDEDPTSSGS